MPFLLLHFVLQRSSYCHDLSLPPSLPPSPPLSPPLSLPPSLPPSPLPTSLSQGMPEAWAKLLQNSGISAAEKKKNPQAVVDVLKFYTNRSSRNDEETKFLTAQRYG